jgi:NADH-quinone oxidoreductase subunit H
MNQIVNAQDIPYILVQPLGFLLFFIAASAEINRSPFDLMEADSEIVAGFHTEYSGMRFAMFYLIEYAEAMVMSAIIATLFLSGWRGPWLPPWLWFIIKTIAVFLLMVWIRAPMPRVRIDQLMGLAWKFLLPLALINLFLTAIEILVWPDISQWIFVVVNIVIAAILVIIWSRFFKPGWGRIEV